MEYVMAKIKLDPKELIGFRLLSGDEISASDTISAKMGAKAGIKKGDKMMKIGDDGWVTKVGDDGGWVLNVGDDHHPV
jgi:hypothetical protein